MGPLMEAEVSDEKNCLNCRFAVHEDFGYSNYTVEGTTFHCGKRLHPDVWIDVDHENEAHLTPEQRQLYDAAFAA